MLHYYSPNRAIYELYCMLSTKVVLPSLHSCPYCTECILINDDYYTYKKANKIFLIYEEIQKGAVEKSYMRKGLLIYEEIRKYLVK
jgi:hypothetical protein